MTRPMSRINSFWLQRFMFRLNRLTLARKMFATNYITLVHVCPTGNFSWRIVVIVKIGRVLLISNIYFLSFFLLLV